MDIEPWLVEGISRATWYRRTRPQPEPSEPPSRPDTERWYCIRTDYGAEATADIEIRLAGITLFAPTIWIPARAARRDGPYLSPARPCRVELLFPRYMFAQFRLSDDWQTIRDLPGVDCILGTSPDSPSPMPDDAIHKVRTVCEVNDCKYPTGVDLHNLDAPVLLEPGSAVRFISGPMMGFHGICEWSDAERVGLLMSILGGTVPISTSRMMVEAA